TSLQAEAPAPPPPSRAPAEVGQALPPANPARPQSGSLDLCDAREPHAAPPPARPLGSLDGTGWRDAAESRGPARSRAQAAPLGTVGQALPPAKPGSSASNPTTDAPVYAGGTLTDF